MQKSTLNTKGRFTQNLGSNSNFWTLSSTINTCEFILTYFHSFSFFSSSFSSFSHFFFRFFFLFLVPLLRLWHTHTHKILPPTVVFCTNVTQKEFLLHYAPLYFKNKGMGSPILGQVRIIWLTKKIRLTKAQRG